MKTVPLSAMSVEELWVLHAQIGTEIVHRVCGDSIGVFGRRVSCDGLCGNTEIVGRSCTCDGGHLRQLGPACAADGYDRSVT